MPITIMKLGKNQQLNFKMIARKGIGRMHAKWSPVATCIMYREPIVKLDNELINPLSVEEKQKLVSRCPRKVFGFNELTQTVEVENSGNCNLCNECFLYGRTLKLDKKAIQIGEDDNRFNFTVESTGALPPVEIVKRAFAILKFKIEHFRDDLLESVHGNAMNLGY